MTERFRAEFRCAMYNAFNHTNLDGPVNNLAAGPGIFGQIFSAELPRVVEFGLRIKF